jgi:ketohexokinase
MARILGIGIATLDIINTVETYPPEDSEVRAIEQHIRRGGNCTNTLVVLAQLGHTCSWAGVLPPWADAVRIEEDLHRHGVDTSRCHRVTQGTVPTSYVTLSRRNGSRSIVHYRDLPEYPFEAFSNLDLSPFDWLHFEGRNVDETRRMLLWARERRPEMPRSVEIEKPRPGIEALFPLADVLLFSRTFARAEGFESPGALFDSVIPRSRGATLICAWGDRGAAAVSAEGGRCESPAFPPPRIVDTLAAGDVFNAAVIHAMLRDLPLPEVLICACQLAGRKCGQQGLDGLTPPEGAQ